ncbi:S41 family peptidase [Ureibacillus terrenus]|uniref:S41 family peptidase n=1 Tax=Ureibacillus terrenus TaxID=118246 RepID=UPI002E21F6ED|nr:S41 family peptidase [Ureibacillus terrenus]
MRKRRFFFILGLICILAAMAVYWTYMKKPERVGKGSDIPVIDQAFTLIKEKSVFDTKDEELIEGALRGMTEAIKDPYSTYYTEKEAAIHRQSLAGERVGIGVEITEKDGRFIVVSPVKNSPAEKAGIRPFDEIVEVDGVRLEGKTMGELLQLIQGKAGEEVTIVLYRPSTDRHIKVTVERAKIDNQTVTWKMIPADDKKIGYVSISMFGEDTVEEWVEATERLLSEKADGIIIDLRDNPGGYLHSVAGVVSSIGKEGKVFAYMQNAEGTMEAVKTAKLDADENYLKKMKQVPLVVLQNEGSASASEVMVGALKSWKRAIIVGLTSFGKGTVQETYDLNNGGELKLSTNKWLTPDREWIHGKGIKSDIEVEQHPLFAMEIVPLRGEFAEGDFGEEIAYVQKVLSGLGYDVSRTDGFYDEETAEAVASYREKHDLGNGRHMDDEFFASIRDQVVQFKEDMEHDVQLKMGLNVMLHKINGDI